MANTVIKKPQKLDDSKINQIIDIKKKKGSYEKYFKRPMDFFLSLSALIVLSPLLLVTAVLIKIKLGSPVIFKQERPGKDEKIFILYKFRTMTDKKDKYGNLLDDEYRLTKFGEMLRKTSIDELPELFNILKGDMSLVGPRPLLVEYLDIYTDFQKRRHEIKPGLTGLAQINGRNEIEWKDKFISDVKYVDNISFIEDWRIILLTFIKVFKKEGISSKGCATAERYAIELYDEKINVRR